MTMISFGARWRGLVGRLGLLLILPVAVGCGSGKGKVHGQVLLDGKPLPGGTVQFRPADPGRNLVSTDIDAEGNYQATIPVGPVKVSVDNRNLEPTDLPTQASLPRGLPAKVGQALGKVKGARNDEPVANAAEVAPETVHEKPAGKYVRIPSKYYQAEKSGLDFTVEGGDQKHDIELKSK